MRALDDGLRKQQEQIAAQIIGDPSLLMIVVPKIADPQLSIARTAAEVIERVSRKAPDLLLPFASRLLCAEVGSYPPEVLGPILMVLPRLRLDDADNKSAWTLAVQCLTRRQSNLVSQALCAAHALSCNDEFRRTLFEQEIQRLVQQGPASIRERVRRLQLLQEPRSRGSAQTSSRDVEG